MKYLFGILTLSLTAFFSSLGDDAFAAEQRAKQPVVVELYTSQGCSSCPPADAYLRVLAERDDVLALSFHVDYWDYIGWPDPFADAIHGDRQRGYARYFQLRYVYTPQMVIQGSFEVAGSRRRDVEGAIQKASKVNQVPIDLETSEGGNITVSLGSGDQNDNAIVWAVTFDQSHTTAVKRGENRGQTLTYRNVVRDLVEVGSWNGTAKTVQLSAEGFKIADRHGLAVLLQSPTTGHILGAQSLTFGEKQQASIPQ